MAFAGVEVIVTPLTRAGAPSTLCLPWLPRLGQVELRGDRVALGDDPSPVKHDPPAVRVRHGIGAQRYAVRVGVAAHDPVGEDEIARPGPGFVDRPTRLPADIKN